MKKSIRDILIGIILGLFIASVIKYNMIPLIETNATSKYISDFTDIRGHSVYKYTDPESNEEYLIFKTTGKFDRISVVKREK